MRDGSTRTGIAADPVANAGIARATAPRTVAPALGLGAARAVSQLGLAVATIALAREMGIAGLGRYAFFTAVGSIGVASVASGLAVAATRDEARGDAWSISTVLRLSPLLIPGIVAVLGAGVLVQGPGGLRPAAAAVVAYALSGWLAVNSALACGAGRYGRAALGEAATGVALPVFTVAALVAGTGIVGALVAVAASAALGTAVMGSMLHGSRGTAGRTAGSSWPFVMMGLAAVGYTRFDAVAVRIVGGDVELGLYSAAYRLLGPVLLLASAFGSVFFSHLSRDGGRIDPRTLRRGSAVLAAMILPVALVEAICAEWLVDVLYGPGFDGAVSCARVLLLAAVPLAAYWPVAHALNASGNERTWASVLTVAMVADALLAGFLVAWWGAVGAAAAWVAAESAVAVFVVGRGRRLVVRPVGN
jgi:O-antigen/teichoic acid export membrane protein